MLQNAVYYYCCSSSSFHAAQALVVAIRLFTINFQALFMLCKATTKKPNVLGSPSLRMYIQCISIFVWVELNGNAKFNGYKIVAFVSIFISSCSVVIR
jgi:hypothetical protein